MWTTPVLPDREAGSILAHTPCKGEKKPLEKEMTGKVYVLNRQGKPLMPTTPRRARLFLEQGKAIIKKYEPFFTIQLKYGSSGYKQPVKLGLDAGYEKVGYSAVSKKEELLCGELHLLEGMSERLKEKAMYRAQKRKSKRYRPPRFTNRKKLKGWLAPSIQHKFDTHIRLVELIKAALPVTSTCIEVASFDIQKIKNPSIKGNEYQQGEQEGFSNMREYVLHRDGHECQNPNCKNITKETILEVHHVGFWKGDRSNRPANMITLCTRCHVPKHHDEGGFLNGWEPKLKSFKPETFMSTVRWKMVKALGCGYTYGYLTKQKRFEQDLPKSHWNDAFVIASGTTQARAMHLMLKQIRRNNRSLQKFYDAKYIDQRTGEITSGQELYNGRRTRNKNISEPSLRKYRGEKVSKGRVSVRRRRYAYQPNDVVSHLGRHHKVKGMQNYGAYIKLDGLAKPVKIESVSPVR
ncbi:MAG: RNA-guided endonuclease IscB [Candidatus Hodarchaeota archaeon]